MKEKLLASSIATAMALGIGKGGTSQRAYVVQTRLISRPEG